MGRKIKTAKLLKGKKFGYECGACHKQLEDAEEQCEYCGAIFINYEEE